MSADFADKTIEIRMYPPHIRQNPRSKTVGAGFSGDALSTHARTRLHAVRSSSEAFTFAKLK
jgi:hypothetical protein